MKHLNRISMTIAAAAVTGMVSTMTSFAATPSPNKQMAQHQMSVKVHVMNVYPVSPTEIKLGTSAKKMSLLNKIIKVQPEHGMGMGLTAKYDAMQGTFILAMGQKLIPGTKYTVSAPWAQIPMTSSSFVIADLVKVMQLSNHELELVYDRPVDVMSATAPGNYWIRNNQNMASGIAELGRNDMVNPSNGLKPSQVMITPMDKSKMKFIMKLKAGVAPGVKYTVIPCSVDTYGHMGYMGPNSTSMSMNMFTGKKFSM